MIFRFLVLKIKAIFYSVPRRDYLKVKEDLLYQEINDIEMELRSSRLNKRERGFGW